MSVEKCEAKLMSGADCPKANKLDSRYCWLHDCKYREPEKKMTTEVLNEPPKLEFLDEMSEEAIGDNYREPEDTYYGMFGYSMWVKAISDDRPVIFYVDYDGVDPVRLVEINGHKVDVGKYVYFGYRKDWKGYKAETEITVGLNIKSDPKLSFTMKNEAIFDVPETSTLHVGDIEYKVELITIDFKVNDEYNLVKFGFIETHGNL